MLIRLLPTGIPESLDYIPQTQPDCKSANLDFLAEMVEDGRCIVRCRGSKTVLLGVFCEHSSLMGRFISNYNDFDGVSGRHESIKLYEVQV